MDNWVINHGCHGFHGFVNSDLWLFDKNRKNPSVNGLGLSDLRAAVVALHLKASFYARHNISTRFYETQTAPLAKTTHCVLKKNPWNWSDDALRDFRGKVCQRSPHCHSQTKYDISLFCYIEAVFSGWHSIFLLRGWDMLYNEWGMKIWSIFIGNLSYYYFCFPNFL